MWNKKYRIFLVFFLLIGIGGISFSLEAATLTYYRYHIVQKGDTLSEIGKKYNVDFRKIKKKNNLRSDIIYPGQKLIIPITVKGIYHEVKRYETLWRICKTYGVKMEEVIRLNHLSDPDNIKVGQRLFIPGATKVKNVDIPEEIIIKKERKKIDQGSFKKPIESKKFPSWPIKEKITGYKKVDSGIDIFAPVGTNIVAPAEGKVYFSGWLRGYGKTIIIEHKELGLFTCYMHNSVNLVKNEDVVRTGDIIAKIGSTGMAEKVKLHFEIRRANDGKPVDPLKYLPEIKLEKGVKVESSE